VVDSNTHAEPPIAALDPAKTDHDPVDIVLKFMRSGFRGLTASPYNFCRVLCEVTEGNIGSMDQKSGLQYGWYKAGGQKKDIIKFRDNAVYEIIFEINGEITLHAIDQNDYLRLLRQLSLHPLSLLISKFEISKEYKAALDMYRKKQLEERQRLDTDKKRLEQKDTIDSMLRKIDNAKSGDVLFPLRGIKSIYTLIDKGFVPGICDNPDLWVDAEEYSTLYGTGRNGDEEILLIGREKLQAVTEHDRIEYKFLIAKSKDKPREFRAKLARFNRDRPGERLRNWKEEFLKGLDILTRYPEELRNKTEADLDVMARAIDGVIVERSRIEEGLLPVDALFKKETRNVLEIVFAANKPLSEIRKSLDYFEHTGMVQPAYKDSLYELIKMELDGFVLYDHLANKDREKTLAFMRKLAHPDAVDIRKILEGIEIKEISDNQAFKDYIYTNGAIASSEVHRKRVKEIVAIVLKSIPGKVDAENITIAMQPYIEELGLDELDRIKQRILVLKEVVASRQAQQRIDQHNDKATPSKDKWLT
jgi:hypothetical protein